MYNPTDQTSAFTRVQGELARLGITLVIAGAEYCINFRHGTGATAYFTDDLEDALRMGRIMAAHQAKALPPMGPTGRRSRKGMMYRHNAKIAAARRRAEGKPMIVIELHQPGELPTVREVMASYLLKLAVVEAYRAGQPIPASPDEAAAFLLTSSPRLWAFYRPEDADQWADEYSGPDAEGVRHAVRYYMAGKYAPEFDDLEPNLYEGETA